MSQLLRCKGLLASHLKMLRRAITLGATLQELGRLEEAEISFTEALNLKPDYTLAHYNLGNILKELGRLNEAEANLIKR